MGEKPRFWPFFGPKKRFLPLKSATFENRKSGSFLTFHRWFFKIETPAALRAACQFCRNERFTNGFRPRLSSCWGTHLRHLSPPKLTSLSNNHSNPLHGDVEWSLDPLWCWFFVRQDQQTNPILMGINQDLRWPVLVSSSVVGRCVLVLQSKVKTLSWVAVLWLLAWFAVGCSAVKPSWWNSL